jgi:hypothetical protein
LRAGSSSGAVTVCGAVGAYSAVAVAAVLTVAVCGAVVVTNSFSLPLYRAVVLS